MVSEEEGVWSHLCSGRTLDEKVNKRTKGGYARKEAKVTVLKGNRVCENREGGSRPRNGRGLAMDGETE